MTEIKESRSDKRCICPIDLSNLKSKVAEAIELCGGDIDCLAKLDQVLSEATELCTGAISQINSDTSSKN
jgi:hypothetical protein